MRRSRPWVLILLGLRFAAAFHARAQDAPDDLAARLGLADLAAYRAALSGKAIADAPPARPVETPAAVSFRDLWDQPDAWRGRRVSVRGRLVRTFRQEAFGEFPPLVEAWLSTRRGDLFCVVHPRAEGQREDASIGAEVRFTGTFLRTIRYPAADEPRLAPLIVGDRPPEPVANAAAATGVEVQTGTGAAADAGRAGQGGFAWSSWLVAALLIAAALVLAWYHSHRTPTIRRVRRAGPRAEEHPDLTDPPLEFLETDTEAPPR
jgi:hypothetical protein